MSEAWKRNLAVPFFTQRDNTYIWQQVANRKNMAGKSTYLDASVGVCAGRASDQLNNFPSIANGAKRRMKPSARIIMVKKTALFFLCCLLCAAAIYADSLGELRPQDGAFFWKQDEIDSVEVPSGFSNYIYAPKEISVSDIDSLDFIPIYQVTSISERRSWKYGDIIYDKKVFIKRTRNIASLFKKYDSYEVFDKRLRSEGTSIFPDFLVNLIQEKREEAKKYSEKEVDEGGRWIKYLSFNLLDFIPKITKFGYYEIYMSERGLDSNHIVFEIKKED